MLTSEILYRESITSSAIRKHSAAWRRYSSMDMNAAPRCVNLCKRASRTRGSVKSGHAQKLGYGIEQLLRGVGFGQEGIRLDEESSHAVGQCPPRGVKHR